ncbi:hypothetical protein CPARA_1gp121 (nucleomorph) [Cryptomonas paramecium]|uniref:Helicase-associated domain-containing protein n=1 Tax=Cryptomonas paramaecium TaxID=2898 RepID=F2HHI3_9CRYP|nr:hypothetical protein CPARA_1gp121 [Cryptomonas paramecium]AEA38779.1 hypothetical protein CPARA_1gp121 [Cryptomonas paramecium]|mmetsp:Transcript_16204/g.43966  ORF Transcript_16204/g.43966 Transcript_16204/m.43966 type:complete len:233 (-) Transcript_16204:206-904(-)
MVFKMKGKNLFKHKSQECNWKEKFEYLHIFRENYGHPNVSQRYQSNPGLGAWVNKQRVHFFKFKISNNRIELLKFLKFNWAPGKFFTFNLSWNKKYKKLNDFRNSHGHCSISRKYIQNRELGFWIKNQRQFFRKGVMDTDKIFLLSKLGFSWIKRPSFKKMNWNQRFKELEMYTNKQGNCLVPQRSGALGKWVQMQRNLYKKNLIKEDRKVLLNKLKFTWNLKKPNETCMFF